MSKFENKFFKILKEQDAEKTAMLSTLEKDTDPAEFEVDPAVDPATADLTAQAAAIKSKQSQAMTAELQGWVSRCDEFLEFLNGTVGESIQTKLANAEPDTIFDRMKQSEQRKIARVATELAALTESFRGYISQTENPSFKYV